MGDLSDEDSVERQATRLATMRATLQGLVAELRMATPEVMQEADADCASSEGSFSMPSAGGSANILGVSFEVPPDPPAATNPVEKEAESVGCGGGLPSPESRDHSHTICPERPPASACLHISV